MTQDSHFSILGRIEDALNAARRAISPFLLATPKVEFKSGNDPVTEADRIVNQVLREVLLQHGEGWLSEESADDLSRIENDRVWVVDPIDGTREFISKIPEWCISVGYVETGRAVAGGICNPATGEVFLGALGEGVRLNGDSVSVSRRESMKGAVVLASRSEVARGEWECFRKAPFVTRPMGSVAYKLALVASGRADATWTACPKNEWDVAAGAALVQAAGGFVRNLNGSELRFNNPSPLLPGLVAGGRELDLKLNSWLRERTERAGPSVGRAG
ncbi:MAG: 3'(2'),5'-bisphosphate nucleotidase CysQ [Candidatus Acidiferrales bacterium]